MSKKKVIISACLLGELCRYDAKTKKVNAVIEAYKDYEIIPFCPEAPLFGTPRERINVIEINGENRIITDSTNKDVTQKLHNEIESFCLKHPHVDAIVLKSKSPSCGYKTTPILDESKEVKYIGSGIAAEILKDRYEDVLINDENSYQ